jgi:hypothetical protein
MNIQTVVLWRRSPVGLATGYGLGGLGLIPGRDKKFTPPHSVQTASGANPTSYPMGVWAVSTGVKAAGARS